MSNWYGVIAEGGRPEPADLVCRLKGHRSLQWATDSEELDNGVTRRWIAWAECGDCGRAQDEVLVRFPPGYKLNVKGKRDENEELSRVSPGSALDPEFYDPSTQADTE